MRIRVHGPPQIDIRDDGTVIDDSYEPDEFGDVTVPLDFWIEGGVPPYDNVYIDYDYDFVTFDEPPAANTVEVTPTPGEGHADYDLVIEDAVLDKEYYIAIRAYDTEAPNSYDTYVWLDPVIALSAGSIVIVQGQYDSDVATAVAAVKTDLNTLGASYDELMYNQVSNWTDLEDYALVIWVRSDYYPNTFSPMSSTYQNALVSYIDNGGNVILMWPGPLYTPYTLLNRCGVQSAGWSTSSNKSYSRIYSGYLPYNGPGGNGIGYFYQNVSRQPLMIPIGYMRPGYKGVIAWYASSSYLEGVGFDNGATGDNEGWGVWIGGHDGWDTWTSTNPSAPGRKGVLWNIVEAINPDLID